MFGAFLAAATVYLQYYGELQVTYFFQKTTFSSLKQEVRIVWDYCLVQMCTLGSIFAGSGGEFLPKLEIKYTSVHLDEMVTDAIQTYSGGKLTVTGPTATAGIFSTYPADYLSMWGGIVDQVVPPPP